MNIYFLLIESKYNSFNIIDSDIYAEIRLLLKNVLSCAKSRRIYDGLTLCIYIHEWVLICYIGDHYCMNAYIHVSFVVANEKSKKLQQFIILTKVLLSLFLVNQIRYCNTKEILVKKEKRINRSFICTLIIYTL